MPRGRPQLGALFACCKAYGRLLLARDGSAFVGHCPRCGKPATVGISDDGEDASFVTVY